MKTKKLLEEIERFNEKNTKFDIGFSFVIEAVKLVHAGIAAISSPAASANAVRSYFEQAKSFLVEAKSLLTGVPGHTPELKSLIERYSRFCDRLMAEL